MAPERWPHSEPQLPTCCGWLAFGRSLPEFRRWCTTSRPCWRWPGGGPSPTHV